MITNTQHPQISKVADYMHAQGLDSVQVDAAAATPMGIELQALAQELSDVLALPSQMHHSIAVLRRKIGRTIHEFDVINYLGGDSWSAIFSLRRNNSLPRMSTLGLSPGQRGYLTSISRGKGLLLVSGRDDTTAALARDLSRQGSTLVSSKRYRDSEGVSWLKADKHNLAQSLSGAAFIDQPMSAQSSESIFQAAESNFIVSRVAAGSAFEALRRIASMASASQRVTVLGSLFVNDSRRDGADLVEPTEGYFSALDRYLPADYRDGLLKSVL